MIIKINKDQYDRCVEFANARIDKSSKLYAYRGESKVSKMIEDIVVGTVGEFAVAQYLRTKDLNCSRPDLKIYEARRKSFDQDLVAKQVINEGTEIEGYKEHKIHVKSQSVISSKLYGHSWLLQKSDKVIKSPDSNEYFAFTEVDGLEVKILGIIKCRDIIKYELLDECKVPWFRDTKRALYFDSIKGKLNKTKLWRL